jgi:hypothetical protein
MPKWFRNLIFNAVRAYSCLRRGFYRIMEQLAAMLAKTSVPGGTAPGATDTGADGTAPVSPLLSGLTDGLPDREVCSFS